MAYSSDIQRLLQQLRLRELTDGEWESLLAAAADDAFLSDAIEGLRSVEPSQRTRSLQFINEHVERRTKEERKAWFPRISAVAVVLVLIGAAVVLRDYIVPPQQGVIVQNTSPKTDTFESQSSPNSGSANGITSDPTEESISSRSEASGAEIYVNAEIETIEEIQISEPIAVKPPVRSQGTKDKPEPEEQGKTRSAPAYALQADQKSDQDETATSDSGGIASTSLPDPVEHDAAEVPSQIMAITMNDELSSARNKTAAVPTPPQQESDANARPQRTKLKKNYALKATGYAFAIPIDGWDAYYKYIRQEISIPEEAKDAGIEGTVWLEFDLDKNGKPTTIRVTDPVGYGCDEEAIRLVQDGPLWDVENSQVPIGRVTIDF